MQKLHTPIPPIFLKALAGLPVARLLEVKMRVR